MFSSLSESGFIPTESPTGSRASGKVQVLISFREWLHSYWTVSAAVEKRKKKCSHLFQRVASFLQLIVVLEILIKLNKFSSLSESGFIPTSLRRLGLYFSQETVLISFREWLHSYWNGLGKGLRRRALRFSSLSESGFIPTD